MSATSQTLVEGQYTNVSVYPLQGQSGSLSHGTGTKLNNTFSCGTFAKIDLPVVGTPYNITATDPDGHVVQLQNKTCAHSGGTSDFKL